ncbi:satratoxin biosynthesis SC1 cluster protein 4 [Colletotrichum spaethianum]|uniref:Satratoxin biosynthesis SC1 cluster protein 4 n=1 Tax=Colletotrichum spaethianum TaxID=700344 RepID=A0AA37LIK2_9PEZI|nr:satratoxin biosynthesis SC1 cluster protein 4 [Colletotrichum spaethianum]GKT47193.1 satratoxin biosynthesis SC1 cluster protein 4 [Colletotrichum spaethianum]
MADTKVAQTTSVTIVMMCCITLTVVMRTFVRSVLLRSLGWDDMTGVGLGSHFRDVSATDFAEFLKVGKERKGLFRWQLTGLVQFQVVTQLTYIWAFVTVKMSFAVLYLRLLPDQVYIRINKFLIILLLAEGIEETAVVIFRCAPIQRAWTPTVPGTCLDLTVFYYSAFVIKLLTDLVLFIQPIPTIWKLQLRVAKRIGVIFMLSLGLLSIETSLRVGSVCVISIIRVSYINAFDRDVTFLVADPLLWSEVEVCALIICSGVPSLRPLISRFPALNKALGLSTGKYSKVYYPGQQTTIGGTKPYLGPNAYARATKGQAGGKLSVSSSSYGPSTILSNTDNMENILPLDLGKPSLAHSVEMGIIKVKNDTQSSQTSSIPSSQYVMEDPYFPAGRPMARRKSRGNIRDGTGWLSDD